MKHIISLVFFALCCVGVAAAGPSVSKEQKETCKALKKSLNAKSVEVFGHAPDAPFYQFATKDEKYGIADSNGKVILDGKYDCVVYIPALDSDRFTVGIVDSKYNPTGQTVSIVTQPTAEGFWGFDCNAGAKVFARNGKLLASFPEQNGGVFNGNYIFLEDKPFAMIYENPQTHPEALSYLTLYAKSGRHPGKLVRGDGTVVIDKVERMEIKPGDKNVIYEITNDMGAKVKGMKCLDNTGFDIPAEFYDIAFHKNQWRVQARSTDPFSTVYNPSKAYNTQYRDKGEALYANHKYDDVLDFYAHEGIEAPWAKFYSGMALMNKIHAPKMRYEAIVKSMENGGGLPANEDGVISDANLIFQTLSTAGKLLNAYLESGDTSFRKEATENLEMADYYTKEMTGLVDRYNKVHGQAVIVTSEAEKRQAQMLGAILGVFSNALKAATAPRATTTRVAAPAGNYGAASAVSSGSSASGVAEQEATPATPTKRMCHACYGSGKCPHCHGKGSWDPNTNGHIVPCEPCRQTGKCHACDGTGYH